MKQLKFKLLKRLSALRGGMTIQFRIRQERMTLRMVLQRKNARVILEGANSILTQYGRAVLPLPSIDPILEAMNQTTCPVAASTSRGSHMSAGWYIIAPSEGVNECVVRTGINSVTGWNCHTSI